MVARLFGRVATPIRPTNSSSNGCRSPLALSYSTPIMTCLTWAWTGFAAVFTAGPTLALPTHKPIDHYTHQIAGRRLSQDPDPGHEA